MVCDSADSNLTLQVDHIVAFEEAEGIELELGHVLPRGMQVGVRIVFDAPDGEENPNQKGELTHDINFLQPT